MTLRSGTITITRVGILGFFSLLACCLFSDGVNRTLEHRFRCNLQDVMFFERLWRHLCGRISIEEVTSGRFKICLVGTITIGGIGFSGSRLLIIFCIFLGRDCWIIECRVGYNQPQA